MPLIDRSAALALINQGNSSDIFTQAAQTSVALASFRTIPMSSKQQRMPVIAALPTAGFLAADNTAKPTTSVSWTNKILEAEEIAVIVPIPENVLDDASFNVWDNVRPLLAEAIGATLDKAVLFGTGKPTSWPTALVPGAVAAGNTVSMTTVGARTAAAGNDLAAGLNDTIALVEADGYDPDAIYSSRGLRGRLRGMRDAQGAPIYNPSMRDGSTDSVYGIATRWVRNGAWVEAGGTQATPSGAFALVGDSNAAIIGVRSDLTYKMLDQATVGGFNLAEQDMVALRVKARFAFQVADPIGTEGGTGAYPFAALRT